MSEHCSGGCGGCADSTQFVRQSYGDIGRILHHEIQQRTSRDLETFNMQWALHRVRAKAEGFTALNKRQFVGALANIKRYS